MKLRRVAFAALLILGTTAMACSTETEDGLRRRPGVGPRPDGSDSEEVTPTQEPAASGSTQGGPSGVAAGATLQTTTDLNLRAGPSTSDAIVATMPMGSTVTVIAVPATNGFLEVRYAALSGWAFAEYLTAPASAPPPAGSGAAPAVSIGGPAVEPHVQGFANVACRDVGCPFEVGTYNGHQPSANLAIDMMMSIAGTVPADGGAHGTKMADYGITNADAHRVEYVIWRQRINTRDGRGWRFMEDRGSITQNHYDHVHVSFQP